MTSLKGRKLEDHTQNLFSKIGLTCVHGLEQVRLIELDPNGDYGRGEHLEFDFLIPYGKTCLVGEVTGRDDPRDVEKKYKKFKDAYNLLKKQELSNEKLWSLLGVPDAMVPKFRDTRNIRDCFITTTLEKFDVSLAELTTIARFYKSDWTLLEGYADAIGKYCKEHFVHHFSVSDEYPMENITLLKDEHRLTRIKHKKVASGELALADVFTFEISPYKLLPFAQVFRRDDLPNLEGEEDIDYQRPLIIDKLESMREKLLVNADFIYPNSILCVLSNDCKYKESEDSLTIPMMYGAMSVIDGQHRLFSFANDSVEKKLDKPIIMITAIQFRNADENHIAKYSAQTFVEINTNQTKINTNHLDVIGYEVLGQTHPRALAAQVILRANLRDSSLYGLFDTYQTGLGIIKINEVISTLKTITSLDKMSKLESAKSGKKLDEKMGYENLFGVTVAELGNAETMITRGVIVVERFFNEFKKRFPNDWPERMDKKGSSFEFAKVIASLIKLLRQLILEGSDWSNVTQAIDAIKMNIISLRNLADDDAIILDANHASIPDAKPSVNNDFKFFNENRIKPISIAAILEP